MKITWYRAVEGFTLVVVAGCAAFLFALMSADHPNADLVFYLSTTGAVACGGYLIAEIYTVTREVKRRRSSTIQRVSTAPGVEYVDACS